MSILFSIILSVLARASVITCHTESSDAKSDLFYSSAPARLVVRNTFADHANNSIYLSDSIVCGEPILGASCSTEETWDVPSPGVLSVFFQCKSGQMGEFYFERGAVQMKCTRYSGQRMQRSLTGCRVNKKS